MKKQDWKLIGRFVATLVQLFSIISSIFKKAGVGLEALEWVVGKGKDFVAEKIEEVVVEYKRQNVPQVQPTVVSLIDCNQLPEIPNWADKEKPIEKHTPCGMVSPLALKAVNVFESGEGALSGVEFIRRARALPGAMNACAFDFYAKPENWKYLPVNCDVIVFPNTEFRSSDGRCCVRCLCRGGSRWCRAYDWIDGRFASDCRVACSQV